MARKLDRIGFQGELGAYSHAALQQLLGTGVRAVPFPSFERVFRSLKAGRIDGAVIPIENTLHGSVHENYDHLVRFGLPIVAETSVRIVHNLIALPRVAFRDVRRVYSHPVALSQCLDFFAKNPRLEKVSYYDTAGSVKMLSERRPEKSAAIASALSAKLYGCHVLKKSIEDNRQNYTRFFLLRKKPVPAVHQTAKRGWKTSLVFTTKNIPGSLFRALSAFALRDLSLTKIESRPFKGRVWEYLFYVDFLGRVDDSAAQKALGHLQELAEFLKVLGSYPRGD